MDEDKCIEIFLGFYEDDLAAYKKFDINKTRKSITKAIEDMKKLSPNIADTGKIFIKPYCDVDRWIDGLKETDTVDSYDTAVVGDTADNYDIAVVIDTANNERMGFEATPWADILGWSVDDECLKKYEAEYLAALVLWEMTWLGFTEKKILKRVREWD